ncbi:uncharacterized protein METZ01_LOCUS253602 [marine metagenome]|uniref:Uncharacterized protein n=1 Tax=marine metagenome TaxID=408172 RepID=A0A382IME0_9ZZZZ
MQSTSVDVVSVNPAAAAELPGHAFIAVVLAGAVYGLAVVPKLATFDAAALAVDGTKATDAHTTAKLSSSAVRFLKLVSISPPFSRYKTVEATKTANSRPAKRTT